MMSMQEMALKLQQERQGVQSQNALRHVFADPTSLDPQTGGPSSNALRQIMQIDPQAGMKFQDQALRSQVERAQLKHYETDAGKAKFDFMTGVAGLGVDAYEQAKASGASDEDAMTAAINARNTAARENGGLLGQPDVDKIIGSPFDPKQAEIFAGANPDWQQKKERARTAATQQARETEIERANQAKEDAAALKSDLDAKKEDERERSDRTKEDEQAKRDAALAATTANKGFDLYQGKDNKTYRINKSTGESEEVNVGGGGLRKVGTQDTGAIDLNDPADKSYIEGIANYHIRPPSAGRNPAQRKAAIEAAQKVNPGYDETKFDQRAKAQRDFGTGPQGNTARSIDVSVAHLDTLRELGRALQNGDVTLINAAKQQFAEEFGVPAPTNFDTAKSIVADEVAKGVIGGQSAQSDRETLASSLRRERSPQAIEGAIDTFQSLLSGQLGGLRAQYKRTTGATDFDDTFLSERTRKALEGKEKKMAPGKAAPTGETKPKINVDDLLEKYK